ncbi:MAG: PAS domain-containing protein [Burkholderiaceae bacterium]|nr:PAS domain-containing protein [Burkholderiaceae bacterium]
MQTPAVSIDEIKRLDALFAMGLLDSPGEERFDRVTRLACALFKVPIALVCLVDSDRQWFKSRQGLAVAETARHISFCAHAILSDAPFVVPDTFTDQRFADNPLVTGAPHVRFYAGIALRSREGLRVGTLCIIDNQPRNIGADQMAQLADLASIAQEELQRSGGICNVSQADVMQLNGSDTTNLFRTIVEHTPGMLGYWNNELCCVYANQEYLNWFGRTPAEMLGIRIDDLMGDALFKKNEPYIRAVLAGEDQQFERALVKPSGDTGHTLARYIAHRVDGQVRGFFVLVSDITAIKKVQEELRISERRILAMISAIPDAIYTHGRDGLFVDCQAASRAQLDSGQRALDAVPPAPTLPAAATDALTLACVRALDDKCLQEVHYSLPQGDGGEYHFEAHVAPYSDDGVISIVRDVTERERDRRSRETYAALLSTRLSLSEAEVRAQEQVMVLAADAANLGVWVLDCRADAMRPSERWRILFGFSPTEMLNRDSLTLRVHVDDADRVRKLLLDSLQVPGYCESAFRIVLPDGQLRWISSRWRGESDAAGVAVAIRGVSVDITARKLTELDLQQKQSELAYLSRVTMLGELSGALAHELNQPLTAILSNAQAAQRFLARDPVDLAEVKDILQDIVDEDKRAGAVIQRLRRLFDKKETLGQDIDVNLAVSETGQILRNELLNRRVAFHTVLAPDLPMACADLVQLQQVLINLIMNGCDAMISANAAERRILVRTALVDDGDIQISVCDQGSGLPPGILEHLFEPFYTTKQDGMGLGLSICRNIVAAHGGRLWGENKRGGGASFHVMLPRSAVTGRAT